MGAPFFQFVVRQALVRRQLFLVRIFSRKKRERNQRSRADVVDGQAQTIVERQMDLDLDEYTPDDWRGLLGS